MSLAIATDRSVIRPNPLASSVSPSCHEARPLSPAYRVSTSFERSTASYMRRTVPLAKVTSP